MLATKRAGLAAAVGDGAVVLAVCGGYQLLGHSYQLAEERIAGLGLADLETIREEGPRLIGNIAIEADLGTGARTLAGFENHGGRTYLGPGATPLGRVLEGHGNNGSDGFEGVRDGNLIGTYLHGPLLPKNAVARRPADPTRDRPEHRLGAGPRASGRHARGHRARQRPRGGAARLGQRPDEPNPPSPRSERVSAVPRPARSQRTA